MKNCKTHGPECQRSERHHTFRPNDEVIGMICIENGKYDILVVSSNGYGKRSKIDDYRITGRGGKGVKTINITEKTGKLIAIKDVFDENDLMIISRSGLLIRLPVGKLPVIGRATQGVKLINLKEVDSIAAVTKVDKEEDEKPLEEVEDTEDIVEGNEKEEQTEN
jgi:DNA gyrase subunit A